MAPKRVGDMTMDELRGFVTDLVEDVISRRIDLSGGILYPVERIYGESEDPVTEGLFSGPDNMAERAEDPTIALTGGPTDFSERAEEILYEDPDAGE